MSLLKSAFAAFSLLLATNAIAKTLTIGADVSQSNLLIVDEKYAKTAARHARAEIEKLQLGDWVHIRKFGERAASNVLTEKVRITRQMRAEQVGAMVERYIAALPEKTTNPDQETNLIGLLELGNFDCANGGRLILYSDAIESSSYISYRDFLTGKPLPKPQPGFLTGCSIFVYGLGQTAANLPPATIKTIKASWDQWMTIAGASFTVLIDP